MISGWVLLLAFGIFAIWCTCRFLLPFLVVVILRKFLKIHIKIGKIGLLAFGDVKIQLKPGLTIEAASLSISSSYVSSLYRTPITLCCSQLRIQIDHEELKAASSHPSELGGGDTASGKPTSNKKGIKKILKKLSRFQFCGIHLEDVDVFITKWPVQDLLVLFHFQHMHGECTVYKDRVSAKLELDSLNYRVIKGLNEQDRSVCLSEGGVCVSIDIAMTLIDGKLWPQEFNILLDSLESHIRRDVSARQLNLKLKKAELKGNLQFTEDLTDVTGFIVGKINGLTLVSEVANLLNLTTFSLNTQLEENQICVICESNELFTGYHHEDLCHIIQTIDTVMLQKRIHSKTQHIKVSKQLSNKKKSTSLSSILKDKSIELCVTMDHSSYAIATATCSGLKGGLVGAKLEAVFKPAQSDAQLSPVQRDMRVAVEASSVYLKLADGAVTYTELQSRIHHWNTIFYMGTLLVRGNKLDNTVTVDTMIYSTQAEISSAFCLVTSKILGAILHTFSGHMTSRHDFIKGQHTEADLNQTQEEINSDSTSGETEPDVPIVADQNCCDTKELECDRNIMMRHKMMKFVLQDIVDANKKEKGKGTKESKKKLDISWNIQVTGVNVYLCNDLKVCTLLRADTVYCDIRQGYSQFRVTDIKLVYTDMAELNVPVTRCSELQKYSAYVKTLEGEYTTDSVKNKRNVLIQIFDDMYTEWSMHLHMCILTAVNDILAVKQTVKDSLVKDDKEKRKDDPRKPSKKSKSPLTISLEIKTNYIFALQLPEKHRVTFTVPGLEAKKTLHESWIGSKQLTIGFDDNDLFQIKELKIQVLPECEKITLERKNMPELEATSNRTLSVTMEKFQLIFPYKYNFNKCFRQLLSFNKWRKIVHKKVKKPFTVDSRLPLDLLIKVQQVTVQLSDDPFEVKFGDNYELLQDENIEHGRRIMALESKIPDLRARHGFLSASKIEELHGLLNKKSSDIYIQRSRLLYTEAPMRTKLMTLTLENLEVMAMADKTLHGRENCIKHMRDIDPDSPYPDEEIPYSTLFCRHVSVTADIAKIQLRDYTIPLIDIKDLHLWGRLVGAEEVGLPKAKRSSTIEMEEPWGTIHVTKNMPALKFYHDFSSDVELFNITQGPCLEPIISYVNQAMDLITKSSVDPSPSLPFWDKSRLLFHGRLTMCVGSMSWIYHASFDPYNSSELMEWTWSDLVLDWTNAKWVLKGDLDIHARTASKYDDCRFLHLPNLKLCVNLDWVCNRNPNAHHLVQPTAPENVPAEQKSNWDSYKDFRSRNLNCEISFETKAKEGVNDTPACMFYASTVRWLDRIKMCIARMSRPIRKGKYFGIVKPKKKSLSRHYKNLRLSFKVHKFQIQYWVSSTHQAGVEVQGQSFALLTGLEQKINRPIDEKLKRRAKSEWGIKQLGVEQNDVTVWLCSTSKSTTDGASSNKQGQEGAEGQENKHTEDSPLLRHHCLSVKTVLYQRAEEVIDRSIVSLEHFVAEEEDAPSHHVQIHQMRGSFTPNNRNIVLSLYDGYRKASTLKKNLSTEALKGFKVDPLLMSPPRSTKPTSDFQSSSSFLTSPMGAMYTGPGYELLQKLVSESDSNFIAVHEELSGGGVPVDQLGGVTACQQDDVAQKKWHVELYNSQVMLKGCETQGHVIAAAAKASVMTCDHRPVWKDQQLRSKNTIVGSLECMQYYATINPKAEDIAQSQLSHTPGSSELPKDPLHDTIAWLSNEDIEDLQDDSESILGVEGMTGSGQTVGGIVCEARSSKEDLATAHKKVQLQRIISRSKCQIFYAGYGELEDDSSLIEVPVPPSDGDDDFKMQAEEGVDTITLLHHDLKICTNSSQYDMILDVVNNLLLFVDSKKKERAERQQRMKFKLHLNSINDQKTPVIQRQNQLREKVSRLRQLEKEMYLINKEIFENPDDEQLPVKKEKLEIKLEECKKLVNAASEELAILISAFKETQLEAQAQLRATMRKDDALLVKRYEVCFTHAAWRMTETDGQIGIADVMLRNFLYTKLSKDDDSGSHQMELGHLKVTNLLPDTTYKDLLGPISKDCHSGEGVGLGVSDKQTVLRILCKFKAPVGGIQIKEHLEVNVLPLKLQVTKRFYKVAMEYFFPGGKKENHSAKESEDTHKGSKKKRPSTFYCDAGINVDDIDKMKERAAKNNMFLYVKIPEVPLTVSYKGLKDKNVTDVQNFQFVVPTVEYHNQTWTWLDLLMAVKNDCKRVLISQAIKQKLHMRSRVADLYELVQHGESLREEDEKAKMLFGTQVLGEKPVRKSLFGKPPHKP